MNTVDGSKYRDKKAPPEPVDVLPGVEAEAPTQPPLVVLPERNETYENRFLRGTENLGKKEVRRHAKLNDYECNASSLFD